MRFAHHLSSHLTPEWRNHYIDYEDLKGRIYKMVGAAPPKSQEEEDDLRELQNCVVKVVVDERQERLFFEKVHEQLEKIDTFYRAREADAAQKMRVLTEQVDVFEALMGNRRTRKLRSTRNKQRSLKLAVSEFYFSLVLLQNFQQLNHTGFRKALKKYDKLTRNEESRGKELFKREICNAYFWKSGSVSEMIEKTETLMIEKLEEGNRSKAMKTLRVPPLESRDVRSQWVTLRVGLLLGMILVSLMVVIVAISLRPTDSWQHVTATVRGLRIGLLLSLWFTAFAINTYGWRRAGVNNVLIFEFDPRNYLNFVQIFEVAFLIGLCFMVGVYLTVFSHWLGDYPEWVGPVVMLGLMIIIFIFPVPFYSSPRLWLVKICGRIFSAPFWHVNFADFWIADQMNSLAVVFLDVEYFICFLVYGLHFPDDSIQCGSVVYGLRPFVAVLPAWFRFAQCLRRYRDTRQAFPHLVNAGKYSTSFFVVTFSSLAAGFRDHDASLAHQSGVYYFLFVLWVMSAFVSTCYTFTWDIKMDWGLFHGKYKLREELIYSKKIYYVFAVIEDLIFRSLWTLNISVGEAGAEWLEGNAVGTVLAVMEVFRRFIWNFFRVENEHLNNCGDFRVVRDISIHPINPTEVVLDDEEGVEPAMRRHLAAQQRKLSSNLVELHGAQGDGLRRRANKMAVTNNLFSHTEEVVEPDQDQDHGKPPSDSEEERLMEADNLKTVVELSRSAPSLGKEDKLKAYIKDDGVDWAQSSTKL